MTPPIRILIVGGYGTFGGRLVELLADDARLTLLVAGRSLPQAQAHCARWPAAAATLVPTRFDRLTGSTVELAQLRPGIVVDASGPFQAYGAQPYNLIERCIDCRINYLDLADGSDFVTGVMQFDARARAAGIYILSGASSFPVLTAAVVRHLSADLEAIDTIRGGIAPSPYAGVGLNVIRAIASYAGQPTRVRRRGKTLTAYPITESVRFVIAVPGHIPLRCIRFSLVDVPDLVTLAEIWPGTEEIWMGAGPVPALLHWVLSGFAWLVRLRVMPSLAWMASIIYFVTNHLRWGEHRGGMFIQIQGRAADRSIVRREWHLLAEGADGPLIPSMAVEAIIRKSLLGRNPIPGARTAITDVDLSDYDALFARRTIFTGVRHGEVSHAEPLYQRILGEAWDRLPAPLRQLHTVRAVSRYSGRCTVLAGRNPIARAIAALVGLPKGGTDLPIKVTLSVQGSGERWVREVGSRTFSSTQYPAAGRSAGLVRERFGPIAVDLALLLEPQRLQCIVRGWRLFGIAMPRPFGPQTIASESIDAQGRFRFDVKLSHPLVGLLVHYAGWLSPEGCNSL